MTNIVAPARMSLQDIKITEGAKQSLTARVLFDNGGQIMLAQNKFCQKAGFKSQPASYTLARVRVSLKCSLPRIEEECGVSSLRTMMESPR